MTIFVMNHITKRKNGGTELMCTGTQKVESGKWEKRESGNWEKIADTLTLSVTSFTFFLLSQCFHYPFPVLGSWGRSPFPVPQSSF